MTQRGKSTITGHGTNKQGNHWCTRDYGSCGTGFHYSNTDDSYYYKNPDGSTVHVDKFGQKTLTTPDGRVIKLQK
ncbi:hypothetical protein DFH29DRAFT_927882 [Suillus ampliporus]|nr:hypothetical protein DFH29DRAFT_927882 [Suillus ampliporus]